MRIFEDDAKMIAVHLLDRDGQRTYENSRVFADLVEMAKDRLQQSIIEQGVVNRDLPLGLPRAA